MSDPSTVTGITIGVLTALGAAGRWLWKRVQERAAARERVAELPPAPDSLGDKPRILFVEDNEWGREIARVALGEEYDVHCVGSVAAAREMLRRYPYDLLILDPRLPDGDGIHLAKLSAPRVLVYGAAADALPPIIEGVDAILLKDGDTHTLKAYADALVHRRKVPRRANSYSNIRDRLP